MNPALRHSAAHVFVSSVDQPELAADDEHHLVRVLRLRDGEQVSVSDGRGAWRLTRFAGGVLAPDDEVHRADVERALPRTTLVSAIPKGDRVDWMVQKLTELGVDEIVFMHASRSVVRWEGERGAQQLARARRIAKEAAMQSRRTWLPELRGPVDFASAIHLPDAVVADPGGDAIGAQRCVLVGPEGGFTDAELESGRATVSVGTGILRVETAAIAVAAWWALHGADAT